jgi:hypothetical protein
VETLRTIRRAKTSNASEYSILENGNRVGFIKKTTDKAGHPCFGVFLGARSAMLFCTFATAKAVAERFQESDFQ